MTDKAIEEFAEFLINEVRDRVIQVSDRKLLDSIIWSGAGARWRKALETATPTEFALMVIPDIVDSVLMTILHFVDDDRLRILFESSNGSRVDVGEAGGYELVGWYYGVDGWCGKFSKERFSDDHSKPGGGATQDSPK